MFIYTCIYKPDIYMYPIYIYMGNIYKTVCGNDYIYIDVLTYALVCSAP